MRRLACVALQSLAGLGLMAACAPQTHRVVRTGDAITTLAPSMSVVPSHRGEGDFSLGIRGASIVRTQGGEDRWSELEQSHFSSLGSADGAVGVRLSRFVELRAMGSLGLGPGAIDAYGNDWGAPSWPFRLGIGIVAGFASDSERFQIQLTSDAGLLALARFYEQREDTRTCPPGGTEFECGPWTTGLPRSFQESLVLPYVRFGGLFGIDVDPRIRLFVQVGGMTLPRLDGYGVSYSVALVAEVGPEVQLGDGWSIVGTLGWAYFDPLFAYGPQFSLSVRGHVGPGPGGRTRTERAALARLVRAKRVAARRAARRGAQPPRPQPPVASPPPNPFDALAGPPTF